MKKGKEKQILDISHKSLVLSIKEGGKKIDEVTVSFDTVPKFMFQTDLFHTKNLSAEHRRFKEKVENLRRINAWMEKYQ